MKANHNEFAEIEFADTVVVNISSSKNESKSQLNVADTVKLIRCCKYQ